MPGEVQQQLGQIARALETIRARTVILPLESFQFQLQTQHRGFSAKLRDSRRRPLVEVANVFGVID
jgi:hypothetical protein